MKKILYLTVLGIVLVAELFWICWIASWIQNPSTAWWHAPLIVTSILVSCMTIVLTIYVATTEIE